MDVSFKENNMKIFKLALPLTILAGLVAGVVYLNGHEENASGMPPGIFSCNGRLEVKRVDVASLYAGRVESVAVDRGQTVSTGDVLVTLSSSVAASQLKSASARRDMVQENLRKNDARITQINEEIRLASIELNDAEHLFKDRLISATELERRKTALAVKKSSREIILREKQETLLEMDRAEAQLEEAASRNSDMTVRAPFDGIVEYRLAEPGNVVGAGGRVVSLLNPDDVTLDVFLPTNRVASVKVGDDARIVLDGTGTVIPAKVDFIAGDAQFTPKYVETGEERAKLLFRVTLRIPEEITKKHRFGFRGGMPAVGYVNCSGDVWPQSLTVSRGFATDSDMKAPGNAENVKTDGQEISDASPDGQETENSMKS